MWEKELEGKFKHRYMAKWALLEGQQIKKNESHDHKEDLIEYHTPKGRASPDHPNVTKFSHFPQNNDCIWPLQPFEENEPQPTTLDTCIVDRVKTVGMLRKNG